MKKRRRNFRLLNNCYHRASRDSPHAFIIRVLALIFVQAVAVLTDQSTRTTVYVYEPDRYDIGSICIRHEDRRRYYDIYFHRRRDETCNRSNILLITRIVSSTPTWIVSFITYGTHRVAFLVHLSRCCTRLYGPNAIFNVILQIT